MNNIFEGINLMSVVALIEDGSTHIIFVAVAVLFALLHMIIKRFLNIDYSNHTRLFGLKRL